MLDCGLVWLGLESVIDSLDYAKNLVFLNALLEKACLEVEEPSSCLDEVAESFYYQCSTVVTIIDI